MKSENTFGFLMIAVIILIGLTAVLIWRMGERHYEKSSSFVGYSQSCWQVGDTLHVVTAKGDTVRLDVSKLNNNGN